MKLLSHCLAYSLLACSFCYSESSPAALKESLSVTAQDQKNTASDKTKETSHFIEINGKKIAYKAQVGTLTIRDEKNQPKAQIFYTAYTSQDGLDPSQRPITFCFNGGPGSSSVWLHMGAFGPKRVECDTMGIPLQPYQLKNNQYSLLDISDLVFIDPVATGYSKAVNGQDEKQFFGVSQDIESVGEFIRLFITKNGRWLSPKFLAGESYGTTRAAGLSSYLQQKYFMSVNGVLLISSVLNWQTLDLSDRYSGNDLPSILTLPSYAASALFHKKIQYPGTLSDLMKEVELFAQTDYALALLKGENIDEASKGQVVKKLSSYTGLSEDFINCMDMRLDVMSFTKQLLKNQKTLIGRFDARMQGIDMFPCDSDPSYDPSFERLSLAYTATFNEYLKKDLGWSEDSEYKILANVFPWNFEPAVNQFLNVASNLRDTMTKGMSMKVFVASGVYDLATPYFATDYTINHMQLSPILRGNIVSKRYLGGHMMYLNEDNLIEMKKDLTLFYSQAQKK